MLVQILYKALDNAVAVLRPGKVKQKNQRQRGLSFAHHAPGCGDVLLLEAAADCAVQRGIFVCLLCFAQHGRRLGKQLGTMCVVGAGNQVGIGAATVAAALLAVKGQPVAVLKAALPQMVGCFLTAHIFYPRFHAGVLPFQNIPFAVKLVERPRNGDGGVTPDGSAAAAAELLYEVICAMRVEITPHIADCLYTGLSTDTGCFKFSSTKASTHITAAKLMEAGAHVEELNTLLFDTKSRERMEAERIARNHLEYHLDGRCALIYLTRDEIEQSRVDPADLEELTSLPISIEGVKVGLTLRQQPGGSYRISVRTAKGVDACAIARRLGGGGHTRAAGCELLGNLDNAKSAILSEVEAVLDAPQEEA